MKNIKHTPNAYWLLFLFVVILGLVGCSGAQKENNFIEHLFKNTSETGFVLGRFRVSGTF